MSSTKQHYSTRTRKWAPCEAKKRPCRYAKHRNINNEAKTRNVFWSDFVKSNLPQKVELMNMKGETEDIAIQPQNSTGKRCWKCKEHMPQKMVDKLDDASSDFQDRYASCPSCGEEADWYTYGVAYDADVKRDEANFLLDDTAVREAKWYHSTFSEDWAEGVKKAGVYVHAGSLEAAKDRNSHLAKSSQKKTVYLYELKIKDEAKINSHNLIDDNDFPDKTETANDLNISPDTVTRYVNRWEHAGSVSIFSSIDSFEIVKRTII